MLTVGMMGGTRIVIPVWTGSVFLKQFACNRMRNEMPYSVLKLAAESPAFTLRVAQPAGCEQAWVALGADNVSLGFCDGHNVEAELRSIADVWLGVRVKVALGVAFHVLTGGAIISGEVGVFTLGCPTRNGKIKNRLMLVSPCATVTPRRDPLRCTTHPKYTATAKTKIRSGIER
jgi:hypothetical protein